MQLDSYGTQEVDHILFELPLRINKPIVLLSRLVAPVLRVFSLRHLYKRTETIRKENRSSTTSP
jgi:hypothetical protein